MIYNEHGLEAHATPVWNDQPGNAQARAKDLARRSEVEPVRCARQRSEGGQCLAAVPHLLIGIVFDHGHAVRRGQVHDLLPARGRQAGPRRIVKIGDEIEELRLGCGAFQDAPEFFRPHAVFVRGYSDQLCLVGSKSLQRPDVAGSFHQHPVARIEQYLRHQVQPLLGSLGDEDAIGRRLKFDRRRKMRAHPFAQRQITLGRAILHRGGAVLVKRCFRRPADVLQREQFRSGQAPGEGDDVRGGGNLEDLPDRARFDPGAPGGETEVTHKCLPK